MFWLVSTSLRSAFLCGWIGIRYVVWDLITHFWIALLVCSLVQILLWRHYFLFLCCMLCSVPHMYVFTPSCSCLPKGCILLSQISPLLWPSWADKASTASGVMQALWRSSLRLCPCLTLQGRRKRESSASLRNIQKILQKEDQNALCKCWFVFLFSFFLFFAEGN